MRIHSRSLCKRFAARPAHVWFFTGVLSLMNHEPVPFRERLITLIALMPLGSFVIFLVRHKRFPVREQTRAVFALINFGLRLWLRDRIAGMRFAMNARFIERTRGRLTQCANIGMLIGVQVATMAGQRVRTRMRLATILAHVRQHWIAALPMRCPVDEYLVRRGDALRTDIALVLDQRRHTAHCVV